MLRIVTVHWTVSQPKRSEDEEEEIPILVTRTIAHKLISVDLMIGNIGDDDDDDDDEIVEIRFNFIAQWQLLL